MRQTQIQRKITQKHKNTHSNKIEYANYETLSSYITKQQSSLHTRLF